MNIMKGPNYSFKAHCMSFLLDRSALPSCNFAGSRLDLAGFSYCLCECIIVFSVP